MRSTNLNILCRRAFVALLLTGTISVSLHAEERQFEYHDFREALKQAREYDLPMIVHFSTQWCGPCKTMNRTVFSSQHLKNELAGKIILVKVDGDRSPELVEMYQITQYPTDLFLDPNGRVLGTSSGMMSLNEYVSQAMRVQGRYRQSKRIFVNRNKSGNGPSPTSPLDVRLGLPAPFPRELLESVITKSEKQNNPEQESIVPDPNDYTTQENEEKPEVVFIALDGYCPVKLAQDRAWVRGKKQWSVEYHQQQYRFSGLQERELFEENPQQYAPRLLGCDPVIMWETDRAIPGSTEFAAFYNDNLYLFSTSENREIFEIDPERYINTRHVLAPRNIEATLIR